MKDALQVIALFLGFLGCVSVLLSVYNNYWRVSTTDGTVITTSTIFENLWMSCADDSSGVYNCWNFPSMLALPGYIQACRALMITSIVMGIFGLVATLVGMQCSKVGGKNYIMKDRVAGVGSVFFIFQGLCTMVAVSWYAFNITQQFFDPLYPGIKYEIGEGLYIGWSSATLALCGGSCLLCACRLRGSDEKGSDLQNFRISDHTKHLQIVQSDSSIPTSQYGRNAYV